MYPSPTPPFHHAAPPATHTNHLQFLATQDLHRVIEYGSEQELPSLIDEALRGGAKLNDYYDYGRNALVIAVRANNHHALSPLLVRGATLPPVPLHGRSLLMEACAAGHIEMVRKLITVAKVNIHVPDEFGKTALHYALTGGSEEIVRLLLKNGANPDAQGHDLHPAEANKLFGIDVLPPDTVVTPLMIAVAKGSEVLTNLLLEAGANPKLGSYSPLIIAASANNRPIFKALLDKGAALHSSSDVHGNDGLCAFVAARVGIDYLYELVEDHDFSDDDGSIESPLGFAVVQNMEDVCALLLHYEAPVEEEEESEHQETIWMRALPGGRFTSRIATLLTASRPAPVATDKPDAITDQLVMIVQNIMHPPRLASKGIFTSLLTSAFEKLKPLSEQMQPGMQRQTALPAAYILRQDLRAPLASQMDADATDIPAHESWYRKADRECLRQHDMLRSACTHLIDICEEKLLEATTLAFFLDCNAHCPETQSMRRFIANRIALESGMPDFIVKKVSSAWIQAASLSQEWRVAPDSDAEGNRFLVALMLNLIRIAADEPMHDRAMVDIECMKVLDRAIPHESQPLYQFCRNPASWLRKFEQRSSLVDPTDDLAYQMQIELGLPYATCEDIANAWQSAIRSARQTRWSSPRELQQVLEGYLATQLNGKFPGPHSQGFISEAGSRRYAEWSASLLLNSSAEIRSRKRRAESELPDAPPAKEARNQTPGDSSIRQPGD